MKRFGLALFLVLVAAICHADDTETAKEILGPPLAIEYRASGTFRNTVGMFQFRFDETINLVVFSPDLTQPEHVVPVAFVYRITLKSKRANKQYYVEAHEQEFGTKLSGTIDTTTIMQPKIDFILGEGIHIVNITSDGRKFRSKYIPNVDLGHEY